MNKTKWYASIKFHRALTKGIIFLFIAQLAILPFFQPEADTVSAEAYCPLGALESLWNYLQYGNFLPHMHESNPILLGIVLLLTLLFRSGFCGWICPFGTVQDIMRTVGKWFARLPLIRPVAAGFGKWAAINRRWLIVTDRYARYLKYGVLIWVIASAAYYAKLIFRDYDPFVALVKIAEFEGVAAFVVLGIVLVLSLFVDRPWCKYACPLGAGIGLLGKLSPLKVTRDPSLCKNCSLCSKSCPMNIDVARQIRVHSADCNQCLTCVEVCPTQGALDLKWTATKTPAVKEMIHLEK